MSIIDKMPRIGTPEFTALKQRMLRLSQEDICQLLDIAEIRFASQKSPTGIANKAELRGMSKEALLEPLDEAKQARRRTLSGS